MTSEYRDHWKANHDAQVARKRDLREKHEQLRAERIGRKDYNAPCEDRSGVTVGEDLADKACALAFDVVRLETELEQARGLDDTEVEAMERAFHLNTAVEGTIKQVDGHSPTADELRGGV